MRYYRINVGGSTLFTSHPSGPGGPPDPGALQVELDIMASVFSLPGSGSGSTVKVWGIGIDMISQAQNFNQKSIEVYGGMGVGLPLATLQSQEAGLLVQGSIQPCFGEWVGNNQSITFIILPPIGTGPADVASQPTSKNPASGLKVGSLGIGSDRPGASSAASGNGQMYLPAGPDNPANIVHNWKAGQPLATAIQATLSTAFPNLTPVINISDSLKLNYNDTGFYQTLRQYADYILKISSAIMNGGKAYAQGNYLGVQMAVVGNTIVVFDGTKPAQNPKTIEFYDLLGQPVWTNINTVQVKTVMRGDINVGNYITLPAPTLAGANQSAASAMVARNQSQFQGTFQVNAVRHVGNFRQPDGMSWNSTFDCIAPNSPNPRS